MTANRAHRSEKTEGASPAAAPSTNTRSGAMLFRIVGLHEHQAVLGGRVFSCQREATTTERGVSIRWSAFVGKTLLKNDCRTLNAAKNLCRLIAAGDQPGADKAAISFAPEHSQDSARPPIVRAAKACEDSR